jgi:hypothetical protein
MDQIVPASPAAQHFLGCLDRANHVREPYSFWLLDSAFPERVCDDIAGLPYAPPSGAVFNGRRETNNSMRVYFNPPNAQKHPVIKEVVDVFRNPQVVAKLEQVTGRDLGAGALRIEYCQDVDGFWLEPHLDISVKLFTMLVYLSGEPELRDAGTDVYDATPEHNLVCSAPYEKNKGLIFIPSKDTWHGFTKRPIRGVRKSIIVNWVTPEWRERWELA